MLQFQRKLNIGNICSSNASHQETTQVQAQQAMKSAPTGKSLDYFEFQEPVA